MLQSASRFLLLHASHPFSTLYGSGRFLFSTSCVAPVNRQRYGLWVARLPELPESYLDTISFCEKKVEGKNSTYIDQKIKNKNPRNELLSTRDKSNWAIIICTQLRAI